MNETEEVFRRVVDPIDGAKLSAMAFDEEAGAALNDVMAAHPAAFMLQVTSPP